MEITDVLYLVLSGSTTPFDTSECLGLWHILCVFKNWLYSANFLFLKFKFLLNLDKLLCFLVDKDHNLLYYILFPELFHHFPYEE